MNRFMELLLWFSATDTTIYQKLSKKDKGTRIAYSCLVLVIGFFAFFTSSYFVSTMFTSYDEVAKTTYVPFWGQVISIVAGILWAFTIMLIDRMIMATTKRYSALLRIPLSLAIGFVIALPLETRMFDSKITKYLIEQQRNENTAYRNGLNTKVDRTNDLLDKVRERIETETKQVSDWRDQVYSQDAGKKGYKSGKGPGYREALNNYNLHSELLKNAKERETILMNQLIEEEKRAEGNYKAGKMHQSWDFPTRYQALSELKEESAALTSIGYFVTGLFVLIELIPSLFKLMKEKSTYDIALISRNSLEQQAIIVFLNSKLDDINKATGAQISQDKTLQPKKLVHDMLSVL